MSNFVHLHVHTEYSFLDGVNKIPKLVEKAKILNMNAIAMTDHGVMNGVYEFWKTCKDFNIKPIIGCEVYLAPEVRTLKQSIDGIKYYHLVLLAKNQIGYKNLIKIVSLGHLEGMYFKPRVDKEILSKYNEGIICTSACLAGPVSRHILKNEYKKAEEWIEWLKYTFKDNFYLELQRHGYEGVEILPEEDVTHNSDFGIKINFNEEIDIVDDTIAQKKVNIKILEYSQKYNLPIIATSDVHYLNVEDRDVQTILFAIKDGTKIYEENCRKGYVDTYLISYEEMKKKFNDLPEAIQNTLKIEERVENFDIRYNRVQPKFWNAKENISTQIQLKLETYLGAVKKYISKNEYTNIIKDLQDTLESYNNTIQKCKNIIPPSLDYRLEMELQVINDKGYNDYFLVVSDIMKWATKNNILVGVRGSVAGSVVAHCLEIVEVEPISWELYFERFLNPERPSPPDIDMDIQDNRRDEVIQYVTEKYGKDNIAAIAAIGRLKTKAAIRDVARVMGIDLQTADKLSKMVTVLFGKPFTFDQMMEENKEFADIVNSSEELKKLGEYVKKIENLSRHMSVHACGYLITPEPIINYVPLQLESGGDRVITQLEAPSLEDLGLMKFDFLGLRTFTIVQKTLDLVNKSKNSDLNYYNIPLDDQKAFDIFRNGETTGVFQFESPPMREYLKNLHPETLEDLCFMAAAYRPGPMKYIPDYIKRKHGEQTVDYLVPEMKPILEKTYGFAIYQEQVIKIAVDLAGYSMGGADVLRRAMGKKKKDVMEKEEIKFKEGIQKKGYSKEVADKIWEYLKPFADYGFNKAHAAGYAVLAYKCAYLKAHYPLEFITALLESDLDDQDRISINLEEARRLGYKVLPPDVNKSDVYFRPEGEDSIRFGLGAIKNIGTKVCEAIVQERLSNGFFESFDDLVYRVGTEYLNKRSLESLIKSGALDTFGDRKQLLQIVSEVTSKVNKLKNNKKNNFSTKKEDSLLLFDIVEDKDSKLYQISKNTKINPTNLPTDLVTTDKEKLEWEKEYLGLFLTSNPISKYWYVYLHKKYLKISQIFTLKQDEKVYFISLISNIKYTYTKEKKEKMALVTLEDESGKIEGVFFPKVYEKYKEFIKESTVIKVFGKVSIREEKYSIQIEEIDHVNVIPFPKKITINLVGLRDENLIKKLKACEDKEKGIIDVEILYGSIQNTKKIFTKFSSKISENIDLIKSLIV